MPTQLKRSSPLRRYGPHSPGGPGRCRPGGHVHLRDGGGPAGHRPGPARLRLGPELGCGRLNLAFAVMTLVAVHGAAGGAIPASSFEGAARNRAFALMGTMAGGGIAVGPTPSGLLISATDARTVPGPIRGHRTEYGRGGGRRAVMWYSVEGPRTVVLGKTPWCCDRVGSPGWLGDQGHDDERSASPSDSLPAMDLGGFALPAPQ